MHAGFRSLFAAIAIVAALLTIRAGAQSHVGDVQLQLGHEFFREGLYIEALEAYQNALRALEPAAARPARTGIVQASLRTAAFEAARTQAEELIQAAPRDPEVLALYGDALWAAGLFEESEERFRESLAANPDLARGRHGMARALAARGRLSEGLNEALAAIQLTPADKEIHHTMGAIYEKMHKFEEAASSYTNYVNLLPNKDRSERADWARSEIQFLRSFGQRVPFEVDAEAENKTYTVDFRLVKEKIVVRAKVNDGSFQDFVVDTGAENTIITAPTARRLGVLPVTYTVSAGVGNVGLRGLQLARIDTLELGPLTLRNVPVMIKDPPLRNLPVSESESLSPLALGFSMIIDYAAKKLTFARHLEPEPADFDLPLRLHRLATVRGTIDGVYPTTFVVDTGGQVISISQRSAAAVGRPGPDPKIPLLVFGSSGWDDDAFLLPGVGLTFDAIRYTNFSVVVLNLEMPSALLGFRIGGIVGHKFLSPYRVTIDLERSRLRLKAYS